MEQLEITKGRHVYEYMNHLYSDVMPIGTKYMNFRKSKDLCIGVEVVAKLFATQRRGFITELVNKDFCKINGAETRISDITYTIIK